ncbi:tRNA (adenosine(37)-N6)-threonylcarbamoyltransferase complex ATPase subunit type 1 TsaE [Bizionia gelidisalsuginis]|uniref:tRNA threonylcarbamoyladenosine biosynthesis protein TsaE n=1 Tax=Bizionia gelidisalsuginis TaxID=291188 RepID=A0ABY3M9P7_9FLAO|nr:tRNA (adenosine(37)-N6)-threonylcarbamoyltransferase complex ATPase subunit type 1 TsaE [Bizionia gelidisalsuginis]TYC11975.1 tRNA (adenosine(37)-N6)-threonylcarbamoyltransferase complex ATPase subunit type 1 TsaE [Bizionia gelidisalsuginis]
MKIEYTLETLTAVAHKIIETASSSNIILFNGDLGAGKTTLIKELVKALGCTETVSSPTYSLVNEYKADKTSIFHFDLYRLEDEEELYNFGIEEYLNTQHWIFVEWPDLLKPLLDDNFYEITINRLENGTRNLNLIYNITDN